MKRNHTDFTEQIAACSSNGSAVTKAYPYRIMTNSPTGAITAVNNGTKETI